MLGVYELIYETRGGSQHLPNGIGKYTEDSGCLQLRPLQMRRTSQLSVSGGEEEESKCRSP